MRQDLPVAVELEGVLGQEVTAFVEGEGGWQVVAAGGPPRPVLVLTGPGGAVAAGTPRVIVVEGTPDRDETRTGLLAGALDVIGWPDDRARLLEVPDRATAASPRGGPAVLRVGGAAGGVGTSTVALALAGLLAWGGRRTLVVGAEDLLCLAGIDDWHGPGAAEIALLDPTDVAEEVGALARSVAGVPGLAVLGVTGGALPSVLASTPAWPADVVVADVRTAAGAADVVVARPDARLRAAAGTTAPVVLVGDGPLDGRGARRVLGRAAAAHVPTSVRVARAGLVGRVPSALPGSWLAPLTALLAAPSTASHTRKRMATSRMRR